MYTWSVAKSRRTSKSLLRALPERFGRQRSKRHGRHGRHEKSGFHRHRAYEALLALFTPSIALNERAPLCGLAVVPLRRLAERRSRDERELAPKAPGRDGQARGPLS